jgi:hypothetical protein
LNYAGGCIKLDADLAGYGFVLNDGSQGFYFDCQNKIISKGAGNLDTGLTLNGKVIVKNCNVQGFTEGYVMKTSSRVERSIAQNNGVGFKMDSNSGDIPHTTCSGCQALSNTAEGFKMTSYAYATAQGYPIDNGCRSANNGLLGFDMNGHAKVDTCSAQNNGNKNSPTSVGFLMQEQARVANNVGSSGHYYGFKMMGTPPDGFALVQPIVAPSNIGASNNKIGFYITGNAQINSFPGGSISSADNELYGFWFDATSGGTPTGQGNLLAIAYNEPRQQIGIYITGNGATVTASGTTGDSNIVGIKVEGTGARLSGGGEACSNSQKDMIASTGGQITGAWKTGNINEETGGDITITQTPCQQQAVCRNGVCEWWLGEKCNTCIDDCYTCDHWCHNGRCDYNIGENCALCSADCTCSGGSGGGGSPFSIKESEVGGGGSPLFIKYDPWGVPCDRSDWWGCHSIN